MTCAARQICQSDPQNLCKVCNRTGLLDIVAILARTTNHKRAIWLGKAVVKAWINFHQPCPQSFVPESSNAKMCHLIWKRVGPLGWLSFLVILPLEGAVVMLCSSNVSKVKLKAGSVNVFEISTL